MKLIKKIVPKNTSGRSRSQIVEAAEKTWMRDVIVKSDLDTAHDEECRCMECYEAFKAAGGFEKFLADHKYDLSIFLEAE